MNIPVAPDDSQAPVTPDITKVKSKKISKLLHKLQSFFNQKTKHQRKKLDSLKKVMKKLKTTENKLKKDLKYAKDGPRKIQLQEEFDIVWIQRRKAVDLRKQLKQAINEQR